MAKDMDGNDLSPGDKVTIGAQLSPSEPPPPGDNVEITVTLDVTAPDGSLTTIAIFSGQCRKVTATMSAQGSANKGRQAAPQPGSPHGTRPIAQRP